MKIAGNAERVARLEQGIRNCVIQLNENVKLMNEAIAALENYWFDMEYQQMRDVVFHVMESVSNHLVDIADLCSGLRRYGELLERDNCGNKCADRAFSSKAVYFIKGIY